MGYSGFKVSSKREELDRGLTQQIGFNPFYIFIRNQFLKPVNTTQGINKVQLQDN